MASSAARRPSTRAIMRSRKVSPGLAVTLTRIQSDSTLVPPVTAERSPPDSRITGADSPVIALSSTEATPSMMSPSAGITSPASTLTISPLRSDGAPTTSSVPSARSRLAIVSVLARRSVSACALPRPSAIASAKLAKSTVSQSQKVICSSKRRSPLPVTTSWIRRSVVSTHPIEHDEHHRVARHRARMELPERVPHGALDDLRIPD